MCAVGSPVCPSQVLRTPHQSDGRFLTGRGAFLRCMHRMLGSLLASELLLARVRDHFFCVALFDSSPRLSREVGTQAATPTWRLETHPFSWAPECAPVELSPRMPCSQDQSPERLFELRMDNIFSSVTILRTDAPSQHTLPRRRQPAWWMSECFEACGARNGAWRCFRHTQDPRDRSRFFAARTHFHRRVRSCQNSFWSQW